MTEDMTPAQAAFYAQGEAALVIGTLAAALIIFLLAFIAVRGFASWK